eukprot:CAMPEP_0174726780 /NCGR_PEP_ID=MMETSP1094-20130205/48467_1 /TAXON_ID=156173 /ORGANISM="Chrysochromulina brevifilum, Strain UTEX LB 985" /LENGTH=175 /DNA_ID=CAMNT_0015928403 /DNA_START=114 /DNA_END=642 /DNA_ORIENTATION=-
MTARSHEYYFVDPTSILTHQRLPLRNAGLPEMVHPEMLAGPQMLQLPRTLACSYLPMTCKSSAALPEGVRIAFLPQLNDAIPPNALLVSMMGGLLCLGHVKRLERVAGVVARYNALKRAGGSTPIDLTGPRVGARHIPRPQNTTAIKIYSSPSDDVTRMRCGALCNRACEYLLQI